MPRTINLLRLTLALALLAAAPTPVAPAQTAPQKYQTAQAAPQQPEDKFERGKRLLA